ncbi:hypothetical protein [Campylobacter curvus]|uniref:hypothetical protein n=1 Tax=Campylobacter curvus TaxID=200 RepID=UPI00146FD158|nr:hypothetical protein [Campylobacter curvus]
MDSVKFSFAAKFTLSGIVAPVLRCRVILCDCARRILALTTQESWRGLKNLENGW